MRTRFYLFLLALLILGLLLLAASIAWAAGPAPSPAQPIPGWAVGFGGGVLALLIGVSAYLIRHWMDGREKFGNALLSEVAKLSSSIADLHTGQAVIVERVNSLPCRSPRNGVPPAPAGLCTIRDKDVVGDG